ncbi:MAG: GNAT family N-acetyltransferase [Methanotrichaceae archaeon]|nr:GNAT family N-acetyltransferase [Methanotrichaceae archaeon]
MITIRPFAETDNEALLQIEKLCPQGDDKCALGVDKKGDISARYKIYDNWKMLVAEDEGKVAGWIGWAIKEAPVKKAKYAYLAEVMVHPSSQRKGVASMLISEAENDIKDKGADHAYCFIYEPNRASKYLFQGLGYAEKAMLWQCALMVYKKAVISHEYSIENPGREDLQEVALLVNEYNKSRTHFSPFTAESFEAYVNGIPAYGLNNFWVAKRGDEIMACAGLWECSYFADLYYFREPAAMKAMGRIFAAMGRLIKLPKIPLEGAHFNFRLIANHAFNPDYPEAMQDLVGFLSNRLLEARVDCLLHVVSPEDMSFAIIKGMKPQIEKWSVHVKGLNGGDANISSFYGM